MTDDMDVTRFEELAFRHGPDPASWPEEARGPAAALLARSGEARDALDRAAALFEALDAEAAAPAPLPGALMARILADAAASPVAERARVAQPSRRVRSPFDAFWRLLPPAALAASVALGVALGYSAPVDLAAAAFESEEEEIWMEAMYLARDPGLFGDLDGEGEL